MRDEVTALVDRPSSIDPPVVSQLPDDVSEVRVQSGYTLTVRFYDGTSGTVDLSSLIHSSSAGVFAVLADSARFAEVQIESGAVTWPCGLDLAPDAMYAALKQRGSWRPE